MSCSGDGACGNTACEHKAYDPQPSAEQRREYGYPAQPPRELALVDERRLLELLADAARVSYLEAMLAKELGGGSCVLRWSSNGRGFRLHEVSNSRGDVANARFNVREAIDAAMAAGVLEEES